MMKLATVSLSMFAASAVASNLFQQLAGGSSQISVQAGASVPGKSPLYHCGPTDDDILIIDKVDLVPNPPVPGQSLTIEASGTLKADIEEGAMVEVTVKYGLITLIKEMLDLCDHVQEVDLKCPIKNGKMVLTKTVDVPKQIPPGKYNVVANAYLGNGEPITCLTAVILFH